MPNGLCDGFSISKARLKSILERFPAAEELANFGRAGGTASEMLKALGGYEPWFDSQPWFDSPGEEVVVQENYGSSYIIMLAPPPGATMENGVLKMSKLWFHVDEESPMYADLVEYHAGWLAQTAEE